MFSKPVPNRHHCLAFSRTIEGRGYAVTIEHWSKDDTECLESRDVIFNNRSEADHYASLLNGNKNWPSMLMWCNYWDGLPPFGRS